MAGLCVNDSVALQYSKWVYPQPIMDLSVSDVWDYGDPARLGYAYWPNFTFNRDNIEILVAGCGTNAAARYAFHHPKSIVVGIDVSDKSLEHEEYLKFKHCLSNLFLYQIKIEDVFTLGRMFDFIDCSGVLHHLADPLLGLQSLRNVLRKDGVIFLMLYARYGRTGIYMFQELFRLMALEQNEAGLSVIKEALSSVDVNHYVKLVISNNDDVRFDAGLVDVFLNKRDVAYTVRGCLDIVRRAGMVFQGWADNFYYYPDGSLSSSASFFKQFAKLNEYDVWSAMELYSGNLTKHNFFICRSDRVESSYKIHFDNNLFLNYVPVSRLSDSVAFIRDSFPPLILNDIQRAVFSRIDGNNSIFECLVKSGVHAGSDELVEFGRIFFRGLWRMGHIFLLLNKPC